MANWRIDPAISGEPRLIKRPKKGPLSFLYDHFGVVFSTNGDNPAPIDIVFEFQDDGSHEPLSFLTFRNGGPVNIYTDVRAFPSKADVIDRLNTFSQDPQSYHFTDFNCETFGFLMMTGDGISRQANNTVTVVAVIGGGALVGGIIGAAISSSKPKPKPKPRMKPARRPPPKRRKRR